MAAGLAGTGLAERSGDLAFHGFARYFAAIDQSIADQPVDAGRQGVRATRGVRQPSCGREQSDGLAAGVLAGNENLSQLWVTHALDGARVAGERAAATLAGESPSGEQ